MADDTREMLRQTFDQEAELYDQARPGYPDALFDDLHALASLGPGAAVLEIGCGTGKATVPLARRGYSIVCIELGGQMAAVARRNLAAFPRVEVVTAVFEQWHPRRTPFDVVFAASSWHWIDPAVRYRKAAALLKPGGALAIVSAAPANRETPDPFFAQVRECYRAIQASDGIEPPRSSDAPLDSQEMEHTGLFARVETRRYTWTTDYAADPYVDLLNTHSRYRAMDPERRAVFFAEVRRLIEARPEKRIRAHHARLLHVAVTGGSGGAT